MAIGKLIKEELQARGKTVAWLARETGIPATTLRSTISRDSSVKFDYLQRIQEALGVEFTLTGAARPNIVVVKALRNRGVPVLIPLNRIDEINTDTIPNSVFANGEYFDCENSTIERSIVRIFGESKKN